MVSISKIGTVLKENIIYKPMNKLGELRPMKRLNKEYQIQNDTVISAVGVSSIVLKDGLGCYMYVDQSLHNDKIPEDKRKFVAALDLVNGLLMISLQIGMFFGFKQIQAKLFNKFLGKYFDRSAAKGLKGILSKTEKFKDLEGSKFYKGFDKYKGTIGSAFNQLTALIATSIVAKRMLVPFLSTPLAGKANEIMDKKNNSNL
jgi:hypothetical protein